MTAPSAAPGRVGLRRARRSRNRRRIVAALAVLVVLTLALTVRLATSAPPPSAAAVAARRAGTTLLLQVRAPDGRAAGSLLLVQGPPDGTGGGLLLPGDTPIAPPSGPTTLSAGLRDVPPADLRTALADRLGLPVDVGWVLDTPTLGRLVGAVGGIDVDLTVTGLRAGDRVLAPGRHRLDGPRTLALLAYRVPGEPATAPLERLRQVVDGVLRRLPPQPDLPTLLGYLGPRSTPSVPGPELAGLLAGLRDDALAGRLGWAPVARSGAGVEPVAVRAVLTRLLGPAPG